MSRIGSFSSEEIFSVMLVFVWVSEIDLDEGASTSWIVEDGSDNALDVTLSFDEVEISISWRCYSFRFGSGVNTTNLAFSLATNDFTH